MEELLSKLREQKIDFKVVNNDLKLIIPRGYNDAGIIDMVKKNKKELIDYINKRISWNTPLKISKSPFKEYYNLSSSQNRLYFLYEFDKSSLAYNMPQFYKVEGELDNQRLRKALKNLIVRHESLRTSFEIINGKPLQKIAVQVDFEIEEFSGKQEISEAIRKFIRPFDLREAPLLRIGLVRNFAQEHILMVDLHHIISDQVSEGLLIRDFMALYEMHKLPELLLQYKDYAEWQQSVEQQEIIRRQREFWIKDISTEPPVLELPYDFPRPVVKSFEGDFIEFEISTEDVVELKNIAEAENSTMYMLLVSIYTVLLGKLGNEEDVIIGIPVASRPNDLENVLGMFVNTLPIRNYPKGNLRFREFLSEVRAKSLLCFDNQAYPYERLVEELQVERDTGRNPLFDVMFAYQNSEEVRLKISGLVLSTYKTEYTVSQFDLCLWAFEGDGKIFLRFEYSTKLFSKKTIQRLVSYFRKIVTTVIKDLDKRIADISIITVDDKRRLLKELNNTEAYYPREETIISLFEQQVKSTPYNTALMFGENRLCYKELNQQCDKVAGYLREKMGIKTGDLVAILLEREQDLIPCIFGILKAGAAYVPINPQYPANRIHSIIKDSGLKVVLTRSRFNTDVLQTLSGYLDLDIVWGDIELQSVIPMEAGVKGKDPAYVIYTSGTTGQPKGVVIEHHSVVNRLLWMQKMYPLKETDVLLQKTPLVFDVSIWELFWWSFTGASLCLLQPEGEKDPRIIINTIKRHRVTRIHFVPSMLSSFLSYLDDAEKYRDLNSLGMVFSSGEALKLEQVRAFEAGLYKYCHTRLINLYGPTEATVDVSYFECEFGKEILKVPIGKPIDNIKFYILDKHQKLVPEGVRGELYIAGVGLARGYLNNNELTNKKFIDSFSVTGGRIYGTGDLVCWLPDGNISYLGRMDNQVKLRGIRIELGEIESLLVLYEAISESVVTAMEHKGDTYLVVYYIAKKEIQERELTEFLSNRLPPYMVPAYFIQVEKLPLTANGKLDLKSLPSLFIGTGDEYAAPSNPIEVKLAAIWSEVLGFEKEQISINKSFFELGGHSIKAFNLINGIRQEFFVNIEVRKIFEHASIASQALLLQNLERETIVQIEKVPSKEYYPTSSAQERLFYQQLLNKESTAYNNNVFLAIKGEVNADKLKRSFQALIYRHLSLRTYFLLTSGGVMQGVHDLVNFEVRELDTIQHKTLEDAVKDFIRPFDLSGDLLIRCGIATFQRNVTYLLVDIHHIICDGVSLNILIKDFAKIYKGESLEPLPLRYLDYACWQRNFNLHLEKQRMFWLRKLSGELPKLDLPIIRDRSDVDIHPAFIKVLRIPSALNREVKVMAHASNASEFMFLISIFYILLAKMSGSSDIIIGTDVVGRTQEALKNIVGTFVNILPLRLLVADDYSFLNFLGKVKECVLEALDNQDYQFEQIIVSLQKETVDKRNGLIDVHFSFDNVMESGRELNDLNFLPVKLMGIITAKYELQLTAKEENGELNIAFTASSALYEEETIVLMMNYYDYILRTVLKNAQTSIFNIKLGDVKQGVL